MSAVLLWKTVSAEAQRTEVEKNDLVQRVGAKLIQVAGEPPEELAWPPRFEVLTEADVKAYNAGEYNAFADLLRDKNTKQIVKRSQTGQIVPIICITPKLLKVIILDEDPETEESGLAFILGHEIAHHLNRDTLGEDGKNKLVTPFIDALFSQDEEARADKLGLEIAVRANYSFRLARTAITRMMEMGLGASGFHCLAADHPSWTVRLERLDPHSGTLWKQMGAFNNGVEFLGFEQYLSAEKCFLRVTRDFPQNDQAFANLGYARLMRYFDAFTGKDLANFRAGTIVCGGFYRRPSSWPGQLLGYNADVWQLAVKALTEAKRLNPNNAVAQANLGLAYMIFYSGKPDIPTARRYFAAAKEAIDSDPAIKDDQLAQAALYINAAALEITAYRWKYDELPSESLKDCRGNLELAAQALKVYKEGFATRHLELTGEEYKGSDYPGVQPLRAALEYDYALLSSFEATPAGKRSAVDFWEQYLSHGQGSSVWVDAAYSEYGEVCRDLGVKPKPLTDFSSGQSVRPVVSVTTGAGQVISLTDPLETLEDIAGKPQASSQLLDDLTIQVLHYQKLGLKVLVDEQVLAIFVAGKTCQLEVKGYGAVARKALLYVGMTQTKFQEVVHTSGTPALITEIRDEYTYYPELGVAARFKGGTVAELVVAQIPYA